MEEKQFDLYHKFGDINGLHSLKTKIPESVVEYQARRKKGGQVVYFNFSLAKAMGLIPEAHASRLYKALEKAILDTFSLVIINEYDVMNKTPIPAKDILPNSYIATRYLQLQHPNKQGRTSGDGRSIWNGELTHKGTHWDISSCGTGATRLSPATSIHQKFFKTGDPSVSYGCGYSELDEGLGTLFMSEVLLENKIKTERVLAIIKFKNGYTVNVRAHPNLLRPSHFFMYVKQNAYAPLKRLMDYYIDREISNGRLKKERTEARQYQACLRVIANTFSEMAAKMEDEYIFCWMDWDGDNILMDGGIIDYGSLRQFGLFHSEYRYDDVQRYSSTIKEQKEKARYIVQTFSQIYEFLITQKKPNINSLSKHWAVKMYDENFEFHKDRNLLYKIGFDHKQVDFLLEAQRPLLQSFRKDFSYFERCKSKRGIHDVADGINHSAIFCMRDILRELPQLYLLGHELLTKEEFIEILRSTYATKEDLKISRYRREKISSFQKNYWRLVNSVCENQALKREQVLSGLAIRSATINKYDRVTGDSVCNIVNKIIKHRPKLSAEAIQAILDDFIAYQNLDPDTVGDRKISPKYRKLFLELVSLVKDSREGL